MILRKTTSLTTLISFIILIFSSVILYMTPQGKIANWANWKLLGLGKEEWGAIHINIGILFITAGILHTILNIGPILHYLRNRAKQFRLFTLGFNIALLINIAFVTLTILQLPPLNAIQQHNESLKNQAAKTYGDPPYGHAEASTLSAFCKHIDVNVDVATKKLESAGFKIPTANSTLTQIARANNIAPQKIYDTIKPGNSSGLPGKPGSGFGKKTLGEVCTSASLSPEKVIQQLADKGIKATATETMKAIADNNSTEASALFELIKESNP